MIDTHEYICLHVDVHDYKCVRKSDFVRDMKIHWDEKQFACNSCDYKLVTKSGTTMKVQNCLLAVLVYNYKSIRKNSLTRHMEGHRSEKLFTCDNCDY